MPSVLLSKKNFNLVAWEPNLNLEMNILIFVLMDSIYIKFLMTMIA